ATYKSGDVVLTQPKEICNAFAQYFNSVYTQTSNYQSEALSDSCQVDLPMFSLNEEDIVKGIKSLKNKSEGMDSIPPKILKNCSSVLAKVFLYIFNLSLEKKTFPQLLKYTLVTPVPKKKNSNLVNETRPIACLTAVSKLFEACVFEKISSFVYNKISSNQHGFIEKRSTVTNLTNFHHFTAKALCEGHKQVDTIYTDIFKAYDRLSHDVLLAKLTDFGFHPDLVGFIASYLQHREHRVLFQNYVSDPYYPTSSVIQGSKLSSLFFAVVIDGVGEVIKHSNYLLYADDLKLFHKIDSEADCLHLHEDFTAVNTWLSKHQLSFHPDKCEVMSISRSKEPISYEYKIGNATLSRVSVKKDLGVQFQDNLKFDKHMETIISSASRTLGLLIRHSQYFTDEDTITTLYTALVRSKLEYAAVIWDPSTQYQAQNLERIQAKFVRFLFKKLNGFYPAYPNAISYTDLMEHLDIGTLRARRKFQKLILLYNIFNNNIYVGDVAQEISIRVPILRLRHRSQSNYFHISNSLCAPVGLSSPVISAILAYNLHSSSLDMALNVSEFRLICRGVLELDRSIADQL
ncbi:hypothetical protein WDU94_003502, partial [Cyamophila willieti]